MSGNPGWIDHVMELNTAIVIGEAKLSEEVTNLVTIAASGVDTANLELELATRQRRLFLMRRMQAQLLQGSKDEKLA